MQNQPSVYVHALRLLPMASGSSSFQAPTVRWVPAAEVGSRQDEDPTFGGSRLREAAAQAPTAAPLATPSATEVRFSKEI